jgi:hypothetical protein
MLVSLDDQAIDWFVSTLPSVSRTSAIAWIVSPTGTDGASSDAVTVTSGSGAAGNGAASLLQPVIAAMIAADAAISDLRIELTSYTSDSAARLA